MFRKTSCSRKKNYDSNDVIAVSNYAVVLSGSVAISEPGVSVN